jgi:hypothetical protein
LSNFTFIGASTSPLETLLSTSSTSLAEGSIAIVPSLSEQSISYRHVLERCMLSSSSYCDTNDETQLYAYDAVYLYAHTIHDLVINGDNVTSLTVLNRLSQTSFNGATGAIQLDTTSGDRMATFDIIQLYAGGITTLGQWMSTNDSSINDSFILDVLPVWYGNTTILPSDGHWEGQSSDSDSGRGRPMTIVYLSTGLQIATWSIMAILLATSLLLHVILVKYRDHTVIRSSAATFCHIMVVGATVGYAAAGVTVLDKTTQAACTTPTLLIGVSFALIIGALVDKTSRMKLIFAAKRLKMKEYSGVALLARISLLLLCEVGIQLTWNLADTPTPRLTLIDEWSNTWTWQCHSNYPQVWWTFLLAPKVGVLLYAVWLAWAVRDIHEHWKYVNFTPPFLYIRSLLIHRSSPVMI